MNLHNGITFSQSLCFSDDTCLLNMQNTISKTSKLMNKDYNNKLSYL